MAFVYDIESIGKIRNAVTFFSLLITTFPRKYETEQDLRPLRHPHRPVHADFIWI